MEQPEIGQRCPHEEEEFVKLGPEVGENCGVSQA